MRGRVRDLGVGRRLDLGGRPCSMSSRMMERNTVEIIPIHSGVVSWVSSVSAVADTSNKGPLPCVVRPFSDPCHLSGLQGAAAF